MTNKSILKILFVEDLSSDVELEVMELRKEKIVFDYICVFTRGDLEKALSEFKPDLIISDYMMPSFNGLQALRISKSFNPDIPFILCTGSVNEEIAVECIKSGAEDYVIKEHMTRLPFAVKEALEQVIIKKEKKASERLLRDSEEKLQSVFASAPVGVGLVVNRVLIEANETLCRIVGYTRKELIGKSSEILYPDKAEYEYVGKEKYRQIAEKGTGSVETLFKCKNGNILNVILSSTPLDREDHSKGVTFTVLDITARKNAEEALRLSEEKFRSIAENLSDIIFLTDTKGILKYVSPSSSILGYSQNELAGRFFGDFLVDGEIDKAMQLFKNALNSVNIANTVQLLFKRKDGSTFHAELSGSVFCVENEIRGVLGLLRDVSDKVSRENELRKLHMAVAQSPVSILITNTEGVIEYVNQKMCEVTGYTVKELIGNKPNILSSNEKSTQEYRILWDTIISGNDWKGEFHNKKKNGELYWESATLSPIKNDKNEITHFLGIKEDITQRKLLEAATLESEKRYRELFLNNPVPTYIFDEETLEFIEVNDATVENYGYSREDFTLMTLKDFRTLEDIPDLMRSVKDLDKGTFYSTSMRHRRKDGTIFPVEITSHSLPEKNGRKTRLVMAVNITERIQAAEQMKLAKEKAEASDKLKTTFLNNISHEVRTPLNGILGFAEIMSQSDLTDVEKHDSLFMLHESSDRLLNTITSYMDISLITSGNISVQKKDFVPGQLLNNLYDNFITFTKSKNLELFLSIPEQTKSISVNSDPELIRKIITHLLNNAVKFTDEGRIKFGYEVHGPDIEFFVSDTGIGIGKDSFDSIFEHFVKEERGPSKISEGSGLGLSIAKGLINVIGGEIRVESELEVGTTFFFSIPLMNVTKPVRTEAPNVPKSISKQLNQVLILVAEDDETNYYYLNAIITREIGAKVLHASNGREAIELFKSNPGIHLILMDIKMPEIDGLEATRQIKLLNPDVPIIAVTAYAMMGDEDRLLLAGCNDYISKPINKMSLLKKIAEFIEVGTQRLV